MCLYARVRVVHVSIMQIGACSIPICACAAFRHRARKVSAAFVFACALYVGANYFQRSFYVFARTRMFVKVTWVETDFG
jgi:hypothetical protein